jgi:hypothetical protein
MVQEHTKEGTEVWGIVNLVCPWVGYKVSERDVKSYLMMSVESGNFLKKLANCFAKLPSVIDGYD